MKTSTLRHTVSALTLVSATALGGLAQAQEAADPSILTPERVFSSPSLNGPVARGVSLSPDGQLVAFLRSREDDVDVLDLWAVSVDGGEPFKLIDARALVPDAGELSEAEKARRERMRISARGVVEYAWDQQGRYILAPLEGDIFLAEREGGVSSISRTTAELSVVCAEASVPEGVRVEAGWRALALRGPIDFALTGVLVRILQPLAEADVGIFALSTYDTDLVLVKEVQLADAVAALRDAGLDVVG